MAKSSGSLEGYTLSIMRIVCAFTYSLHGYQKLFGFFGGHSVKLASLLGAAGVIESVGGTLLILGLFTRPVAFILCGEMAVAYFKQHAGRGLWPIANGGELAVVYCFIFLFLTAAGAGPVSLDRIVRKK